MAVVQEPLTERGRRSRERIIEAAVAAVAERGAGGCSLDQILEAAGASKSQLYHYFADKGDLLRAVIARCVGETLDCQGPMLDGLDSFADIRRWFDMADRPRTRSRAAPAVRSARSPASSRTATRPPGSTSPADSTRGWAT